MTAMSSSSESAHIFQSRDGDRQFIIHPENDEIIVSTGKQIIQGCQLSISVAVWLDELKSMVAHLQKWCSERSARVSGCYLEGRGSKILLLFIPTGTRFNFDLADELAVLNRELVAGFNIGMVEVGQIPAGDVDRFLDLEKARLVYGNSSEASGSVAAQS